MTVSKLSRADLRSYQKLLQKKFRQEEEKFIVEGIHLVEEVLRSDWEAEAVIATAEILETMRDKQSREGAGGLKQRRMGRGAPGVSDKTKWVEGSARDLET